MENIEDEIKKARFVKKLQAAWSVTNNIIGYSLIAAVIILGVKNGYCGSTHFAVFCWAAGIYFFSKYIYYPLFTNRKYHPMTAYKKFFAFEHFTSFLGNGNVLFGRFDGSCYSFLSIMYIPLIPTFRMTNSRIMSTLGQLLYYYLNNCKTMYCPNSPSPMKSTPPLLHQGGRTLCKAIA